MRSRNVMVQPFRNDRGERGARARLAAKGIPRADQYSFGGSICERMRL
jgi:hypothetical protein